MQPTDASGTGHRFAVVDESFVAQHLAGVDPLGQLVEAPTEEKGGERHSYEIVGVVAAHRHNAVELRPRPNLFVLSPATPVPAQSLVVALTPTAAANPAPVLAELRRRLAATAPDLPLFGLRSAEDLIAANLSLFATRLGAIAMGFMGTVALVLVVIGVYGVKSYQVSCRTREIGIRLAVGAHPRDILRLMLGQTLAQLAVAIAIGVLLALGIGRALSALLYDVSPADPLSLALSILTLGVAGVLACWLPARRATRVDPMIALRAE